MILTIDIGGTSIKSALYREDGEAIETFPEQPTQVNQTGNTIAEQIVALAKKVQETHSIKGVAISSAAIIHPIEGKVMAAGPTIPGYAGTELKKSIEQACGVPCTAENDVNCAALGESWLGAAKDSRSVICITVGTGVGGALLMDGKLWHGHNYAAGEIGFIPVPPKGDIYELTASTTALVRMYEEKTGEKANGKIIFARAADGETMANEVIDQLIENIATGLFSAIYLFAPETIIVGGGIAQQKQVIEPKLRAALERRIIRPYLMPKKIVCAELGNSAGMIGALRHFLQSQS
ncbi:ROK family protein [Suttonella ornithocola]|uniref:Beta-glucoside kinase n=1 Tax=Suttonella ornithocola TaxID=279832 RepID=A0A380MZZ7_9GAMM|nr:ROK family protein [Suttonella ornithocola]SUO97596.1 Beta-glucoside kinase [Suttonella ornithocola]